MYSNWSVVDCLLELHLQLQDHQVEVFFRRNVFHRCLVVSLQLVSLLYQVFYLLQSHPHLLLPLVHFICGRPETTADALQRYLLGEVGPQPVGAVAEGQAHLVLRLDLAVVGETGRSHVGSDVKGHASSHFLWPAVFVLDYSDLQTVVLMRHIVLSDYACESLVAEGRYSGLAV